MPGMFKCNKECHLCPFINETKNIAYLIQCEKCNVQYIGDTERSRKERLGEHKGYIKTDKLNEDTGEHFNIPGRSI